MKIGVLFLQMLAGVAALPASAQTVTLDRSNQIPGGQVVVSATGFPDHELSADILLDGTRVNLAGVEDGRIAARSIRIPTDAEPGPHVIGVLGRTSGVIAEKTIQVTVNWLQPGYDAANSRTNPHERIITAETAGDLVLERRIPVGDLRQDPIIYARNIYLVTAEGKVRCIDLNNWRTRWTRSIKARSLVVSKEGRMVAETADGALRALNPRTGAVRQTFSLPSDRAGIMKVFGDRLYYYAPSGLYAFDLENIRTPVWVNRKVRRPLEGGEVVVAEEGIVLSDLISVLRVDPAKGAVAWRLQANADQTISSIVAAAGRVMYAVNERHKALPDFVGSLNFGGRDPLKFEFGIYFSYGFVGPSYYKGNIYVHSGDTRPESYIGLGVTDIGSSRLMIYEQTRAVNCDDLRFSNDIVFCSSDASIFAFSLKGEALWARSFPWDPGFPVVSDGRLYVEAGGLLYVFTPASRLGRISMSRPRKVVRKRNPDPTLLLDQ